MDVRMVIRQGVQYALARRGVRVLQAILTIAIAVTSVSLLDSTAMSRTRKFILIAIGIILVLRIRDVGDRLRHWIDRRFFREAYNAERILSELSEQVRGILDRDCLLETVARRISESLHVDRVAVMLQQNGMFRPALAIGYPAPVEIALPADDPALHELRSRQEPLPAHEAFHRLDAELLLPLASHKDLLGFISLGPKRSEEPYSPSDTSLLRTVAVQTGLALENSRLSEAIAAEVAQRELLNREIEIAREVQQRLFPQKLPEVPALRYAGYCRPARGVGGDYYDFLALSSGRLGLAIGDVSGKGVPAALLMASLQASVRGQSQAEAGRVAELMTNVNRLVCDATPENRYATFFYGQFDPATRRLVYTNGGHNAPMLLRGDAVQRLEAGGPPVGLFRFSRYVQEEIQLEPGDLLLLYTDGISEAENPAEEEWGEEALIAAARSWAGLCPSEMITRIMEGADAFAAGAPQHDDMTLVVAQVLTDCS
jgi:sigma-B regulation protein RsbU (phosphoserine phosphatase)